MLFIFLFFALVPIGAKIQRPDRANGRYHGFRFGLARLLFLVGAHFFRVHEIQPSPRASSTDTMPTLRRSIFPFLNANETIRRRPRRWIPGSTYSSFTAGVMASPSLLLLLLRAGSP